MYLGNICMPGESKEKVPSTRSIQEVQESEKRSSELEMRGAWRLGSKSPNLGSWDKFMGHGGLSAGDTWLVLRHWTGDSRRMLQREDKTDVTALTWEEAKHSQVPASGSASAELRLVGRGGARLRVLRGLAHYPKRSGLFALQGMRTIEGLWSQIWVLEWCLGELWVRPRAKPASPAAPPGVSDASRAEAVGWKV